MDILLSFFQQIPLYLAYLTCGLVILTLFFSLYLFATPYDDLVLINQGNVAAAITLGSALISVALVLASSAWHMASLPLFAAWGFLASIFQLITYLCLRMLLPQSTTQIKQGNTAIATLMASLSLCVGLVNAATLS